MQPRLMVDRRRFIGGSDARIIMGDDEAALLRLWREKRGEVDPEDLSCNLIVQLGVVTEELNRRWYEANTGQLKSSSMCSVGRGCLSFQRGISKSSCRKCSERSSWISCHDRQQ